MDGLTTFNKVKIVKFLEKKRFFNKKIYQRKQVEIILNKIKANQIINITKKFKTGSSIPVKISVEGQDDMVLKWTGCGDGAVNNIVELIGLKMAHEIGLPAPKISFIEVRKNLIETTKDPEVRDIIKNSLGLNLGVEYLDNTVEAHPNDLTGINDKLKEVLFAFDILFLNFDRYRLNCNILLNNEKVYFIDFASLLEIWNIVRVTNIPKAYAIERLRYHPFYQPNLNTEILSAIDDNKIVEITSQIPDSWLKKYHGNILKTKTKLYSKIKKLFNKKEEIIESRLSKINKINYQSQEKVRKEQIKKRRELEDNLPILG